MIADGGTFMPSVMAVLIRSRANVASKTPAPDFYFSTDDGGIVNSSCTPIPVSPSSSARCIVQLKNDKSLDVSFATKTLRPADNVERSYQ
jgi:hypothetical protein